MADEITLDAPETRIERFLAAAAGVEGITLDEPETRIERCLYKIAQGSGGVPTVEDADKGKFLHANESTGALEWAEGGSGGGVLMVGWTFHEGESGEVDGQPYVIEPYFELDKTWQELADADIAILSVGDGRGKQIGVIEKIYKSGSTYKVDLRLAGEKVTFDTSASSGYPRMNAPQP